MPEIQEWVDLEGQGSRRVTVDLETIPSDPNERRQAIQAELDAKRYRIIADPRESVNSFNNIVGQALELVPEMAGISMGAARGAQAGAAFGHPAAPVIGAIAGGIAGGVMGRSGGQIARSAATGEPPEPIGQTIKQGAKSGLTAEAFGVPLRMAERAAQAARLASLAPMSVRESTVRMADTSGLDLTAAERSGSGILKINEMVATRSATGMKTMREFEAKQAKQLYAQGEKIIPIREDQLTRSNKFLTELESRIEEVKQAGSVLFEDYVASAGPKSKVPLDELYAAAWEVRKHSGGFQALKNSKLEKLLKEIEGYKKDGFTHIPLENARRMRGDLGQFAYPKGTTIVGEGIPSTHAIQLERALHEGLKRNAVTTGTLDKFERANQYRQIDINMIDSQFYKLLLSSQKSLASMSTTLFNSKNLTTLLDARTVTNKQGWKLIQQQYWDDVFQGNIKSNAEGHLVFDGTKFSDRIKHDKEVLRVLYGTEEVKAIEGLADQMALATQHGTLRGSEMMGLLVGGAQLYAAGSGLGNLVTGEFGTGLTKLAMVATPYFMAKAATNPTSARWLAARFKTGRLPTKAEMAGMVRLMIQMEAVREARHGVSLPPPMEPTTAFQRSPSG